MRSLAVNVATRSSNSGWPLTYPLDWTERQAAVNATKRCPRCKTFKPEGQFARNARAADGLQAWCRDCCNAHAKSWYAANRAGVRRNQKVYRDANRPSLLTRQRAYNEQVRLEAVAVYGGECAVCGSRADLEFDHVNNDGREHRKTETPQAMFRRIARAGARLTDWDLQLLCPDHHRSKTSVERRAI